MANDCGIENLNEVGGNGDNNEEFWDASQNAALEWDSEAEVSETDFGLGLVIARSKHRITVAQRKRQRKARISETLQQEQERRISRIIRE